MLVHRPRRGCAFYKKLFFVRGGTKALSLPSSAFSQRSRPASARGRARVPAPGELSMHGGHICQLWIPSHVHLDEGFPLADDLRSWRLFSPRTKTKELLRN